jgi:hypothetical protein
VLKFHALIREMVNLKEVIDQVILHLQAILQLIHGLLYICYALMLYDIQHSLTLTKISFSLGASVKALECCDNPPTEWLQQ